MKSTRKTIACLLSSISRRVSITDTLLQYAGRFLACVALVEIGLETTRLPLSLEYCNVCVCFSSFRHVDVINQNVTSSSRQFAAVYRTNSKKNAYAVI